MKLRVRNGQFEPASLFKFVFVGTLLGEGLIVLVFFVPMFLMSFVLFPASNAVQTDLTFFWMMPILLPVIVGMHALMFGGMIVLGLWLFTRRGKLEIVEEA